jgi:hypothetical protein
MGDKNVMATRGQPPSEPRFRVFEHDNNRREAIANCASCLGVPRDQGAGIMFGAVRLGKLAYRRVKKGNRLIGGLGLQRKYGRIVPEPPQGLSGLFVAPSQYQLRAERHLRRE